jgi:hypothetical protein
MWPIRLSAVPLPNWKLETGNWELGTLKYWKQFYVEPIYWLIPCFLEYKRAKRYNPK